jgi:hypothetical protein
VQYTLELMMRKSRFVLVRVDVDEEVEEAIGSTGLTAKRYATS